MTAKVRLFRGDITRLRVDAIVNAANTSLLGGGGVDGAIHRAAGPELLDACRELNGCSTGYAKITRGFNLPAKYVIHTVGPVWKGGNRKEPELLQMCYQNSLEMAVHHRIKTIAFPNISTGVYGFPKQLAAEIAIATAEDFLENPGSIEELTFVVFDGENHRIYNNLLA
jgi:O-acetyl-ADP-ribose deacetylase (regulator of RNase III)